MEKHSLFWKNLQNLTLKSSCLFKASHFNSINNKKKWSRIFTWKNWVNVSNCLFLRFLLEKQRPLNGPWLIRSWWGFWSRWRIRIMGKSSHYNEKKWKLDLYRRWSFSSKESFKRITWISKSSNKTMDFKAYWIFTSCCKKFC